MATSIKFASYNIYGINNGYSMLSHLRQQCDVILIQEHWLQSSELQKLGFVDNNFACLAVFSMDDKISRGMLNIVWSTIRRYSYSMA